MKKKEVSNQYLYLTILITFITFGLATLLHDPILHYLIAYLNGWEFASYSASIGIGNTDVFASPEVIATTSTFNYWLFFMFPSMAIFILSFLLVFYSPNRLIIVVGLIFMFLNFSSLLPNLVGSDAYKAIEFLISRNWTFPEWILSLFIIMIISVVFYIIIKVRMPKTNNIWYISIYCSLLAFSFLKIIGINFVLSPELGAYLLHYIILIVMFLIFALFLYIGIENNPKDARERAINIFK